MGTQSGLRYPLPLFIQAPVWGITIIPMKMRKTTLAVMIGACFSSQTVMAEEETKTLSPVVVTATRVEQDSFDLPMSIDRIESKDIQNGQLRMTLSESLIRVPGLTAQSRNQMAQDPQISTRGFGARSSFGVRGIRLFVDGVPLSMPDGIGNPGSIDLDNIGAIEVMRGPFSTMYGNSSGGVIQMFTENSPATPTVSGDVLFGSFGTHREAIKAAGVNSGYEYLVSYSNYSSDGFREQSANDKRQATARLKTNIGDDSRLTTLINWFDQNALDPGGLTRAEARSTPTLASGNNKLINARVERSNTQIGLNYEKTINQSNTFNLITYAGDRANTQYLYTATPAGETYNSRASDIKRNFYGTELRLANKGEIFEKPYVVTAGIAFGQMRDNRLDINADSGVARQAIDANLNRNEKQTATNFDQYIQANLSATSQLDLHAGIRNTRVDLEFTDYQVDATKCAVAATRRYCDTSGSVKYNRATPAIGATFKVTPVVNLYANFGKAFETPTLVETSFLDASAGTGPNLNIKPSTSDNYELGAKALIGNNTRVNAALFRISTENEIITNTTVSGRTSYQNGKTTTRSGAEFSIDSQLQNNFSLYGAYTFLDATFSEAFGSVQKGNYIPGTYRSQIYGEIAWKYLPQKLQVALEGRYNSRVYVSDDNSDNAPSYFIFNVRGSIQQEVGHWRLTEYVRIENIFDKDYIGSIRVNDSNSRFFEPAPGRNWIVGVKANYIF